MSRRPPCSSENTNLYILVQNIFPTSSGSFKKGNSNFKRGVKTPKTLFWHFQNKLGIMVQ